MSLPARTTRGKPPKRKDRGLPKGLLWLLIAGVVVAGSATVAQHFRAKAQARRAVAERWIARARRQHDLVARIIKAGGSIQYADDRLKRPPELADLERPADDLGDDLLHTVIKVNGPGSKLESKTVAGFTTLNGLEELTLDRVPLDDKALDRIGTIRTLKVLDLDETGVTDSGLAKLSHLESLHALRLSGNPAITDAGLVHLEPLRLTTLALEGARVTDAGLARIGKMATIRTLYIGHTQVTDSGLASLKLMPDLFTLGLDGCAIGDAGLAHLAPLKGLQMLYLDDTKVGDAGLETLARLSNLTTLSLTNTTVGDAGLVHLTKLSKLHSLSLRNTRVTDAGMEYLRAIPSWVTLDLRGIPLSPAGYYRLNPNIGHQVLVYDQAGTPTITSFDDNERRSRHSNFAPPLAR